MRAATLRTRLGPPRGHPILLKLDSTHSVYTDSSIVLFTFAVEKVEQAKLSQRGT